MKVILALLALVSVSLSAPSGHLITELPGVPGGVSSLNFSMYSGYVNIDEELDTNFFYWFVESQRDPVNDPVLIWLNGGPGASSLMGFFSEHGPFRVNPDGTTLSKYDYSWNKVSNIIYLEAPIGVGFSESAAKKEYITNDGKTADQNYRFLLNWFELFPEFKSNDFYITGESYGGKYCPQLAAKVLDGIQAGETPWLNMKGITVGNPGTQSDWYGAPDEYAYMTFLYTHMLIPQYVYQTVYDACEWDTFLTDCQRDWTDITSQCKAAGIYAATFIPRGMDVYDVYAPACTSDKKLSMFAKEYTKWTPAHRYTMDNSTFYPCIDDYVTSYLNIPDVQTAIHVNATKWSEISHKLIYRNEYENSVVPLWQRFINETNWKILIFSGDVDSAVPTIGTQRWINCLDLPIVTGWRPWHYNGQVAGVRIDYQGLAFQTIKGAGHMVPYYLPAQGYAFFATWLDDLPVE